MTDRYQLLGDAALTDAQLEDLRELFDREWWSQGRSIDEVRDIVANSQVCVGHVDAQTGRLVSFARVVTDYRVFAVVLDVIVDESIRGEGLGKRVMDAIFAHPELQQLRGIGLQCRPDLIPFYARWGFAEKQPVEGASLQLSRRFDRDGGERPADCVVAGAR